MKTLIIFLLLTVPALAQPWPHSPPPIGQLFLKQEYWNYIKEAAQNDTKSHLTSSRRYAPLNRDTILTPNRGDASA